MVPEHIRFDTPLVVKGMDIFDRIFAAIGINYFIDDRGDPLGFIRHFVRTKPCRSYEEKEAE
jgi:hypothetical protein